MVFFHFAEGEVASQGLPRWSGHAKPCGLRRATYKGPCSWVRQSSQFQVAGQHPTSTLQTPFLPAPWDECIVYWPGFHAQSLPGVDPIFLWISHRLDWWTCLMGNFRKFAIRQPVHQAPPENQPDQRDSQAKVGLGSTKALGFSG